MKLHLPKLLFAAVMAACSVSTTVWAKTGWSNTSLYIGGETGDTDGAGITGLTITTPDGGKLTTYADVVDATDKTGTLYFYADDSTNTWTNAQFGDLQVGNGVTLQFSKNSYHEDYYFDTLTIDQLTISDSGSVNLTISEVAHNVLIKEISGTFGDITATTGNLTITGSSTVTGKLYSNGGNVTLGDGTNSGMLTVNRIELSDEYGGSSSENLNVKSGYTLKVTGSTNSNNYKNTSFLLSEWASSTVFNVEGTVLAENAAVLTGDSNATINIENGGILATKGMGRSNTNKTPTTTINLKDGGKLVLGDTGLNYGGYATVNVSGGTIGIAADTVTIAEVMNVTGAATLDTNKYTYGESSLAQGTDVGTFVLNKNLTGSGSLSFTGNGTVKLGVIDSSVNINTDTANVIFDGTFNLADSATFTVGSGSLSLDSAIETDNFLISGTNYVDKNGTATTDGNGFKMGSFTLINGGSISGSFTVSYEGNTYTIDNDNRAFGSADHVGLTEWYINSNSSNLSDIYEQSATANVIARAGTTVNADAALTTGIVLKGNVDLNITQGVDIAASSITRNGYSLTLSGSGAYSIANGDSTSITLGDQWTGTVKLHGQKTASLDLTNYGRAGSTLDIQEYVGYIINSRNATKEIASHLVLTNTNLAAIELTNGYSGCTYWFSGDVTGNGNFLVNKNLNNGQMSFKFSGDVSGWTGQMAVLAGVHNVTYTGNATTINAQIEARTSGTLNVTFDHTQAATINSTIVNGGEGVNMTVKNTATTTFTSNVSSLTQLNIGENTNAVFSNTSNMVVNALIAQANASLTMSDGSGSINAGTATLNGGATITGSLDLADATELTLNNVTSNILIEGDLSIGSLTLGGDVLTAIESLQAGQTLSLLSLTGSLTLGGESYSDLVDLSSIFTNVTDENLYLGFTLEETDAAMRTALEAGSLYVTKLVPEPSTAALSLLALAGVGIRRRRK